MTKCVRCSSTNERALSVCLGCGADLRPLSRGLVFQVIIVMAVTAALIAVVY